MPGVSPQSAKVWEAINKMMEEWSQMGVIGRVEPQAPAKSQPKFGATCAKCNEYNQYAEAKAGFTCFGCRT